MKTPSKVLGVLAVGCAFIGMASVSASASVAVSPTVRISRVVYDPSGPDTHSNVQINRETVQLKNTGKHSVSMAGWTLRDTSRHVYVFGGFTLRAGALVTVHTGIGTDTAKNLYQDRRWYVWNNTGDTATLKTAAGRTVATCRWRHDGSGAINC